MHLPLLARNVPHQANQTDGEYEPAAREQFRTTNHYRIYQAEFSWMPNPTAQATTAIAEWVGGSEEGFA